MLTSSWLTNKQQQQLKKLQFQGGVMQETLTKAGGAGIDNTGAYRYPAPAYVMLSRVAADSCKPALPSLIPTLLIPLSGHTSGPTCQQGQHTVCTTLDTLTTTLGATGTRIPLRTPSTWTKARRQRHLGCLLPTLTPNQAHRAPG